MDVTKEKTAPQLANKSPFFLDLLPGKLIDLQFSNPISIRFKLTLVGYETGKYLILKCPAQVGKNDFKDVLVEGNGAIVRYIVEDQRGECVAFTTNIIALTVRPERLMYLAYPKNIESRQLREASRLQTHIPAKISVTENPSDDDKTLLHGLIIDISPTGCRFAIHVKTGFLALKRRQVFVHILSPQDSSTQVIRAYIRNNQMKGDRLNVGIEFAEDEQYKLHKLLETYANDINMSIKTH